MSVKGNTPSFDRGAAARSLPPQGASELGYEPVAMLLDALPMGVFVASGRGRATYQNPAATRLLGRSIKPGGSILSLAKRHAIYRAGTDELYPNELLPLVRAARGETCSATDLEVRRCTPPKRLGMHAAPRFDRSGRLQWVVATLSEVEPVGAAPSPAADAASDALSPTSEVRLTRNFEAIGQLAAGVAHEINTPMQYIGDNTAFLGTTIRRLLELAGSFEQLLAACRAGQPPTEAVLREYERELQRRRIDFLREQAPTAIEQTLAGIDQVRSIVQALKEFSHPGEERPANVDINHLVRMASTITRNSWRYVAELELELCEAPLPVLGHAQELGQVLINLIVNGCHAIEERWAQPGRERLGKLTIRTRSGPDHVEIQVSDDGNGIPEAIRDRIMAPYFTTKPAGKGTGQGLPLARRVIVDQHRGNLFFESELGVGTTFFIVLAGATDG